MQIIYVERIQHYHDISNLKLRKTNNKNKKRIISTEFIQICIKTITMIIEN